MAVGLLGRFCVVFSLYSQFCASGYVIPDVQVQALSPKGLRASIPDAPNISLFAFQGNVNRAIANNQVGTLAGEVLQPTNGQWVFEDPNIALKVGDVVNYYVFVSVDGAGYLKDGLSFTVVGLDTPAYPIIPTSRPTSPRPTTHSTRPTPTSTVQPQPTPAPNPLTIDPANNECRPTATVVMGGAACAGQVIFEDDFSSLREDVWQIEQYIPFEHPEYPFITYQRGLVSVTNGYLRIAPVPQQNLPGFNNESMITGELNLISGCSGIANECIKRASGADILPPVASGRVTSKAFAFTYGTVHVRAKLPQGDWLYPEILLESFRKKYGSKYASGVVKIATTRGNKELRVGVRDFGNQVLYGGPIMDFQCRQYLIEDKKLTNGKLWGDDFHVYSVTWTPENITLLVDGEEWFRVEPQQSFQALFPPHCRDLPRNFLSFGTKMAPFDDHFFITLGVAAGGITEFRDDFYTTGYRAKPWRNHWRKASLHFWNDLDNWLPTWTQPELLVDYVKVVAL